MEETLALAQLSPDCFTHPQSRPLHTELVQRFFLELWNAGALVVKDMPAFFCAGCRQHLYEAEVSGLCPHCGEQSGGLECEQCARRLDTTGLREPRCTGCGAPPQVVALPRIVLSLERVRQGLADFVAAGHRRPRLAEFLTAALQRPLPDVPFTRLDPLGIPVPLPGWEGHVLDTWFGGIWGYFAAAGTWAGAAGEPVTAEQLWKDPDTRIIHFLGFDCSFSHALFWPGLLLAHGDFRLPDEIITNEFYRLEGEKFSTSRGHAIWGGEFLREQPSDAVRFHLCLDGPETSQTSFSATEFAETSRSVLREGLQAWADGVLELVHTRYGGVVPEPRGTGDPTDLPDGGRVRPAGRRRGPPCPASVLVAGGCRGDPPGGRRAAGRRGRPRFPGRDHIATTGRIGGAGRSVGSAGRAGPSGRAGRRSGRGAGPGGLRGGPLAAELVRIRARGAAGPAP